MPPSGTSVAATPCNKSGPESSVDPLMAHPPRQEPSRNAPRGRKKAADFLARAVAGLYGSGATRTRRLGMKAHPATRPASLVVIEFGASWPRWLDPSSDRGDLAVVAQHYAGPPTDLITQVAMRVTRLQARGWRLSTMVLVSNGRADVPTAAARSVLARGLLAHLAA